MLNVDKVRKAIAGRDMFHLSERAGYLVANYRFMMPGGFQDPDPEVEQTLRNCRGVLFDPAGNVISLPYAKFFNLGENELTHFAYQYDGPVEILRKLDGSMVRPVWINGDLRWATKAGLSDMTNSIESHVSDRLRDFAVLMLDQQITPIFEYCTTQGIIVVQHDETEIILTGLRDMRTGNLWSYPEMLKAADPFGIKVVPILQMTGTILEIAEQVRDMQEDEGVVIRYPDGEQIKIKSQWYMDRHHVGTNFTHEKDVVAACIEGLDDILPLLDPARSVELVKAQQVIMQGVMQTCHTLDTIAKSIRDQSPRDRAEHIKGLGLPPLVTASLFRLARGDDLTQEVGKVLAIIKDHCNTGTRLESVRPLWGGQTLTFRSFRTE